VLESARYFDTWVLMADTFYADDVRRYLAGHGEIDGLHFEFLPKTAWQRFLSRMPGGYYLALNLWHRRALRKARELHRQLRFDLVHQVKFCGYREPGYLWKLAAPFVWGPVGGTQNYPWRFLSEAGLLGAVSEGLHTIANGLQLRLSGRVRSAARRAQLLLAANSSIQRDFARVHGISAEVILETGAPPVASVPRRRDPARREIRILWSGEFTPRKCLPLLLRALPRLPADVPYRVRVLGRGPQGPAWQRLARRLGVAERIEWLGWLPHQEALDQYRWADLFVFTSLRDTTGTVVLEALAAGLPVICLDHQGVHDVVSEQCGCKIPPTNPRDVAGRLAEAICALARDPGRWEQCSAAAIRRAEEYSWPRQGERMAEAYRRVLARAEHPPQASGQDDAEGKRGQSPFVRSTLRAVPANGDCPPLPGPSGGGAAEGPLATSCASDAKGGVAECR
jgi:glycosyltransferase involved in cell wall biosynthesis